MRKNKVLNICTAGVILFGCVSAFALEESSKSFIPETTYIKGLMLNGLSVQASSADSRPVVIQVTEKHNISANFGVDLKHCRILGRAHGDLASERIIIEAESMSCEDSEAGQIRSIKIEGEVVGPDGISGIPARVVRNDDEELEKAATKLTAVAVLANNKLTERAVTGGYTEAMKMISGYHLKQAENLIPVLHTSGGTYVDVIFTQGVSIESSKIAIQDRN